MKKTLVILAAIIGVVLIGNVLVVAAQAGGLTVWPMGPGMAGGRTGVYTGTMPFDGMLGRWDGFGPMHDSMVVAGGMHEQVWTAVAQKLGMTYAELTAAVQNGQTVAQIAAAKGVSLDDLKASAHEAGKAALADLVQKGVLTQEQADWMLDRMDDMPMFSLNFGPGFGPGGCHGNGQPGGMMNGWRFNQPSTPPTGSGQG